MPGRKNFKKGNRSSTPAGPRNTGRTPSTTVKEEKKCEHVRSGVNHTKFKKKLTAKKSFSVKCEVTSCQSSQEETVWVCLKCAHQGCGRYSEDKHALKHCESTKHPLAINLNNWDCWCYTCDRPVDHDTSRELQQCVAELRRRLEPDQERKKHHPPSSSGALAVLPHSVKGLTNIGNTCFFNSVIQNLNQTFLLHHCLKDAVAVGWQKTVVVPDDSFEPLDVVVTEYTGDVTAALSSLLGNMSDPSKKGAVTPRHLFNHLRARVRKFEGYRQQDSHELLRHLLDEMKTEETHRVKRAILACFNVAPSSKESMKSLTDKDREKIKCYGRSVNHTFVDQVFGGDLISTIVCQECGQVSKLVEEFLDLSVPVPSEFKHHKDTSTGRSSPPNTTVSKHQLKKQKDEAKKQQKHDAKLNKKKGTTMTISQFQNYDNSTGKQEVSGANEEVGVVNQEVGGADKDAPRQDGDKTEQQGKQEVENDDNEQEVDDEQEVERDNSANQEPAGITGSGGNEPEMTAEGDDSNMQACREGLCCEELQVKAEDLCEHVESMNLCISGGTSTAEASCDSAVATSIRRPEDSDREEGGEKEEEEEEEEEDEEVPEPLTTPSVAPKEGELEHCLTRFTSKELLTGKDRYACDRCTERGQQKKRAARRNLPVNGGEEGKGRTNAEMLTEGSGSGDVMQHSSDQPDTESDGSEGKEETVFADAEKRFLIQRLPPVLTLHLKRFEQRGMMRVTKNNRHVTFPRLLDMAPFCTRDSEGLTDSDGRLLYSLYGVVEHHGSMAGGHYVAYVRVRPSSSMPARVVSGAPPEERGRGRGGDTEGGEEEEGQSQSLDPSSEGQTNGAMVQGEQVETTKEESEEPVKKQELVRTSETEGSVENQVRKELANPSDDEDHVEKSVNRESGASSRVEGSAEPHVTSPPSACTLHDEYTVNKERRFDESSTAGQWYYISDSQVSAVSEGRVLNSQAFLLFYEKLPLINVKSN